MDELYTIRDLQRLFSVSRKTIYNWMERGWLGAPSIRVGRTIRWTREQVEQFKNQHKGNKND
jgi:excisionase family DNA binding protein